MFSNHPSHQTAANSDAQAVLQPLRISAVDASGALCIVSVPPRVDEEEDIPTITLGAGEVASVELVLSSGLKLEAEYPSDSMTLQIVEVETPTRLVLRAVVGHEFLLTLSEPPLPNAARRAATVKIASPGRGDDLLKARPGNADA